MRIHEVRAESGKGSVRTPGPSMIRRMMWIPSGAARWPYHRRGSVADLTTRSLLSRHASRMGTVSPTAACRMYRGRARPACHGGRGCWAGGQKSSYNARHAGVAQLVERRLPKPEVASSRLVARSTFHHRRHHRVGGHGVQAHGQHPKVHSRRHPGRFPAAAARAFQRQAPISSPPVFWQRAHEARHHVSPLSCAGCSCCRSPCRRSRPGNTGRIRLTSEACCGI